MRVRARAKARVRVRPLGEFRIKDCIPIAPSPICMHLNLEPNTDPDDTNARNSIPASRLDILISTPLRLVALMNTDGVDLDRVETLIFDEVTILIPASSCKSLTVK